jgi:hypothetical protein
MVEDFSGAHLLFANDDIRIKNKKKPAIKAGFFYEYLLCR